MTNTRARCANYGPTLMCIAQTPHCTRGQLHWHRNGSADASRNAPASAKHHAARAQSCLRGKSSYRWYRSRNLHPIVINENEPATKKDLAEFAADLTAKLTAMEERLVRELWRTVDVVIEQIGAKVAAIAANPVGHRRSY